MTTSRTQFESWYQQHFGHSLYLEWNEQGFYESPATGNLFAAFGARPAAQVTAGHAELQRLAEAATPGPWSHDSGSLFFDEGDGPTHMMSVEDGAELGPEQQDKDLDFIAAANPAAVLGLIAENDKLLKLINRMIDQYVPLVECEGLPGYSRVVELVEVVAERDQLRVEVEALRKDAERYRWTATDGNWVARFHGKWRAHTGECGDANPTAWCSSREEAIDAAMSKEAGQ